MLEVQLCAFFSFYGYSDSSICLVTKKIIMLTIIITIHYHHHQIMRVYVKHAAGQSISAHLVVPIEFRVS